MKVPPKIATHVKELNRNATHAELQLFAPLQILCKVHNIPFIFQCPLKLSNNSWIILDFLLGKKIAIELDGIHHTEDKKQKSRDKQRDDRLKHDYGIETIRFSNNLILNDPLQVAIDLVDSFLHNKGEERKMSRIELEANLQWLIFEKLGIGFY